MSDKRMKTGTIFTEKNNQEGMHSRYKSTISALNDLMKDTAFAKYRRTLDEVAKAIARALENDQKWSVKCKMLQAELDSNESRMKIALELSERDKNAIISLQNELKAAWNLVEELKLKNESDFKHNLIDCGDKKGEEIEKKSEGRGSSVRTERNTDNNDANRETKRKTSDNEKLLEEMTENQDRLHNEIERMKLQVFELEEELANKEKTIEELTNALNSKSNQLEDVVAENIEIKQTLDHVKPLNDVNIKEDKTDTNSSKELKLKEAIYNLKKKLHDVNKKDQISLEKVKHLIRKNKILSKQLQTTKNQYNLMKLELGEQTKMLDLLSCQFCKLEEKDKKQAVTITELENVRNKYIHVVGNLEQKIHDMRKKSKKFS